MNYSDRAETNLIMKPILLLLICFSSILLTGCPGPYMKVKVTNSSAKYFSLEMVTHDDLLRTKRPQRISSVIFSKRLGEQEMDEIWRVESQEKSGKLLTEIVYGKTPDGFRATNPRSLAPSDVIYISFYGREAELPDPLGTLETTVSSVANSHQSITPTR
ncbi:hypothetical protein [Pantanalinema sp. GBBB05]|uniref:hypothetical protein n=1 Tax=Pantanalinema sp. GBBB05 TaxID=2604139 RepID=UPI001D66EC6E|nr:hypothetical protein [Pantanalinema sp. GBBB05]